MGLAALISRPADHSAPTRLDENLNTADGIADAAHGTIWISRPIVTHEVRKDDWASWYELGCFLTCTLMTERHAPRWAESRTPAIAGVT
jgi:hypothetical protein